MAQGFLFKRQGSQYWHLRTVIPADLTDSGKRKVVERSLGEIDRDAADLAAADQIKKHKTMIFERRQARRASVVHGPWEHEYTPGQMHPLPETMEDYERCLYPPGATHVLADDRTLTFLDAAGNIVGKRSNGGMAIYLTGGHGQPTWKRLGATGVAYPGFTAAENAKVDFDAGGTIVNGVEYDPLPPGSVDLARPKVVTIKANPDDALLETYITHAGLNDVRTKQARAIWATFKRVVVDKPLAKCTRDDGRAVVAHLEAEHLKARKKAIKAATLRRYMVPLIATVNLAISDGKHSGINPFVNVVPDRDDSDRVLPFDDNDVKLMRANLHKLSDPDQLLVRVLATCGLRRGEAFAIDSEQTEGGCRFTIVGSKTEQSLRRVPFPSSLVKHLPKKIGGPLFTGRKDNAGKRIGKWMGDIGIDVAHKSPLHSFRHRAKDKLRSAGCPLDIQYELLGHERRTVAAGYGNGSPVPVLKKWLDQVGF